ncbi:CLUMA_CG012634, isoform A [Clunio marinus]|uniref:CLUMA_CG012634, isoform A n=1 Tax=Clunio marinus TaxID=568069 RepID=A0A1J1IGM1_9DIPT|nr:CLUMA_CG012634, isoform A [Clunio marinus]
MRINVLLSIHFYLGYEFPSQAYRATTKQDFNFSGNFYRRIFSINF